MSAEPAKKERLAPKELFKKFSSYIKMKDGRYSANFALLTALIALFLAAILCGSSLWIPAARIKNLHVRSIALAVADAFASFAASTGLDKAAPAARSTFIASAGLEGNLDWDSRYYNRRESRSTRLDESDADIGAASADLATGERAGAQVARGGDVPPLPASSLASIHSSENPLRVYVFGDSQAYSIGIGLSRLAGRGSSIEVDFLPVHSSGFIRQDYFSWQQMLADTFSETAYDAGVIMLGMNDYQNFWTDSGDVAVSETPFWDAAYKEKCRAIIDTTLMYLPKLYWIGMPLVKNAAYAGHLAYIENVQRSLAEEYSPERLVYIHLRDTVPGRDKPYSDVLVTDEGRQIRVMSDDGTHLTVEGGQIAMLPVFEMLCRDFLFSELPVARLP